MRNVKLFNCLKSAVTVILAFCLALSPSALFFGTKADAAYGKWISTWATSLVNGSIELGGIIPGDF